MSYSTISIVRHNIADAHYLPEPLPYSKLKEKYPSGVRGLSNFQAADIAPLVPARLTRSASYIPIQRAGSRTVLTFDENQASLREQQPLQARASSLLQMSRMVARRERISLLNNLKDVNTITGWVAPVPNTVIILLLLLDQILVLFLFQLLALLGSFLPQRVSNYQRVVSLWVPIRSPFQ